MAGTATVDFGTQTSDIGSDEEDGFDLVPALGNASPRVVIDTSPPFGSVEEAVIRFGGRGFWIPRPFLHVEPPRSPTPTIATTTAATTTTTPPVVTVPAVEPDVDKLEERAAAMLNDLATKEQETLEILKELQLTKRLVEDLKLKLLPTKEAPPPTSEPLPQVDSEVKISSTPEIEYNNNNNNKKLLGETNVSTTPDMECLTKSSDPAGLILSELRQAKLNLYQNTSDLAAIRASVESLSKKMEEEKQQVVHHQQLTKSDHNNGAEINPLVISRELRQLNYEAEQFMNTAEAARSEVLKAMSDIEQTKSGLKVIEMRWLAAKKLEEAARAAESLALAEIKCLSSSSCTNETTSAPPMGARISLSVQEYESLLRRKNKELSKVGWDEVVRRKLSPPRRPQPQPPPVAPPAARRDSRLLDAREFEGGLKRPTTSIGDILSQKLVLRDDLEVEESRGRQRVSLNQMLRRHRGSSETPPPVAKRTEKDHQSNSKQFFSKRKGLGFVHISLPISKQSKSKIQALNLWG